MMKHVFPLSLVVILSMAFFSCKSSKKIVTTTSEYNSEQTEPQMLASIKRTACYGQCPMYKATFMDNGEVKYIGRRFVEKVGTYRTLLSAQEVQELKQKITEYDYYRLDSLYPTPISDFPSCITEANLNNQYKMVVDRRNPPSNLKAFEKFLDSLLEGKELEKVSEETDY